MTTNTTDARTEQIERYEADLVSGRVFARHAASARSVFGYQPAATARQYGTAMQVLGHMAAEGDHMAQVASKILGRVNLYATPAQAVAAIYEAASQAMAAGFDDVIGRSGPEAGRHGDHQHETTLYFAASVAVWLSKVARCYGHHNSIGWVLADIIERHNVPSTSILAR